MEDTNAKFIAQLAASIAPELCLTQPEQAIAAARNLLEAARKRTDTEDEEALWADAELLDKFGFKRSGNLTISDAFSLQQQSRFWKGKRSAGPYKNEKAFADELRSQELAWIDLNGIEGTSEAAIVELFMRIQKARQRSDVFRKSAAKKKNVRKV